MRPVIVGLAGQPNGPNDCGRGEALFEELVGAFAHPRCKDVTAVVKSQLNVVPKRVAGVGEDVLGSAAPSVVSGR